MEYLSFWAILAGLGVAIGVSSLGGLVFGIGVAIDTARDIDPEHDLEAFDEAFEEVGSKPGFIVQIIVLSVGAAVLSGAVTAWLAPDAPYLNAAIVGAVGTALGIAAMPAMPDVPRVLAIVGTLATLPATLAGAWLMT